MDALHWFLDPITKHYADFEGRVSRQTFWMYILFYVIAYILVSVVSETLALILALGLFIPNIAITARRLHDTGRSGWWQLIGLIPIIGWIIIIIWCVEKTGTEANAYGPAPTDVVTPSVTPTPAAAQNVLGGTDHTPTDTPVDNN